jgi:perosamine synthetase
MTWKVPVGSVKLTGGMMNRVVDVLHSEWFSPGPQVKEFEGRFAKLHGCEYGIMVNSGTDALRISLLSLKEKYGWKDGDEVLVPALTFVATVNTVKQCGLKPVLVDVDEKTWVLEAHSFADLVTERTRAIIPVHLFGLPADMPRIQNHAEELGLRVIEDSCESMGVGFINQWGPETGITPEGKKPYEGQVGSFGDFGCFSTYSCHLIVTGVGGLITTHKSDLDQLARSYANHGRDPYFLGGKTGEGKDPTELIAKRFSYLREGYSARASEFEAAVGNSQLDNLQIAIKRRAQIAAEIRSGIADFEYTGKIQLQRHPVNRGHANMMFPILIKDPALNREEVCLKLEQAGIETRPALPLVTQPVYQGLWNPEDYPVAYDMARNGFYVGCHPGLTEANVYYLISKLKEVLRVEVSVAA